MQPVCTTATSNRFSSWNSPSENLGRFHFSAGTLRELSGYNRETMWCTLTELSPRQNQKPQPQHSWQHFKNNKTEKTTNILLFLLVFSLLILRVLNKNLTACEDYWLNYWICSPLLKGRVYDRGKEERKRVPQRKAGKQKESSKRKSLHEQK